MTGAATIFGGQKELDTLTGRAATPGARTMYLAALTAAPTRSSTLATMAEVATAGYARQTAVYTAPTSADPSVTGLNAGVTWGPFSADPPNVTHLALVSASSGTVGDLMYYWAVDTAKDVGIGDSISCAAASASISSTG